MRKNLFLFSLVGIGFFLFIFFWEIKKSWHFNENFLNSNLPKKELKAKSLSKTKPPLSLKVVKVLEVLGQPEFVFVKDNLAFLASGYSGIQIFDVTEPQNAKLVGSFDTPGYAEGIFVLKNFAYVADKDGGFLILDVSNPKFPKLINRNKKISAEGVFVKDGLAFLAYAWWGIKIFDVSNPALPKLILEKDLPDESEAVFVDRNYLFVAKANWTKKDGKAKKGDLQIFDISDPKNPNLVFTHFPSVGYAESVFVKDNLLFLAVDKAGFLIFDISNPQKPVLLSNFKTSGSVESIFVFEKYAFLASGKSGLKIIDVSQPENPKLISTLSISGFCERIFVSKNYIYLAVKETPSLANINTKKQKGYLYIIKFSPNHEKD